MSPTNERILFSWSSGKDSAMALTAALKQGYQIDSLITVVRHDQSVSVHGVSQDLLRAQASALGLPLIEVEVNEAQSYEVAVSTALREQAARGIRKIAYGDLYLEDIKQWRERFHKPLGLQCIYPIWQTDTTELAQRFIHSGYKAAVVCVDTKRLGIEFAGRDYDQAFLNDLPKGIDPCGENGEFHTFVYDAPEFSAPIALNRPAPILREFDDPGHRFTFGFCEISQAAHSN
ncbi:MULTISPECIES: diphthine--ammonia ligase [unclassified Lentimonas]|uniref:Dph6-related ATP pyrophosphatase n=1 Tax=unclassified Lentimonas TaxID=2630993 RepID=UPI0013893D2A|nr:MULTISPECIES: diphthine--ammonia ligase [unclassified Lentimonas]